MIFASHRKSRLRHCVLPFSIAAMTFAIFNACSATSAGDEAVQAVVSAQTITVAAQPFSETIGGIGQVVPRVGHVATLSAPVAGRVAQVYVASGDRVRAGEPLIRMDQTSLDAAGRSAHAALLAATQENDRQKRLAEQGIVPRKAAEVAAAALAQARSDEITAQRNLDLSVLRSPIAGVVSRMSATIGAAADPTQPLVEISDPRAVDALINVTPADAAGVHAGASVTFTTGQNSSGDTLATGSVLDVAATVDTASRGVAVRASIRSMRRPLRIGETVFGAIVVSTRPDAVVIPEAALVPDADEFTVFVVDSNNIAHVRKIKLGARSPTGVEVVDGLKAGEKIVAAGAYAVSDSARITPPLPDTSQR
jgi:membrane fusion protein (multidrug efflux system)